MEWLRRNFDTCFVVIQVWLDGLCVLASFFLGFWLYNRVAPGLTSLGFYRDLVVVITGVTLISFWGCGLYRWRKSILNVEEYRAAFKATLLSFLCSASAIFLLRAVAPDQTQAYRGLLLYDILDPLHGLLQLDDRVEQYSRVLFVCVFLFIFLVTSLQRAVMFHVVNRLHSRGYGNTNVAVYGTGELARRVQQKLRLFPTLGYRFVGFLDEDASLQGTRVFGHPVLGRRAELESLCRQHSIHRLIIADERLEEEELVELCRSCSELGLDYQVVPRLHHLFSQRFSVDNLDSIPLITVGERGRRPVYQAAKRAMDIVVSVLVLISSAPLMGIIALLIKRGSSGGILFRQIRVGQHGRTFQILKFRTMYVDLCGDATTPNSRRDPRITRIGSFLRATSLDELPQFWCVLRGDMSLVGPRPEMPFIVDTYSALDRLRLDAKPGITGLWQVSPARKDPIHHNLDYDLYYIENQSLFLDLVILIMTVLAVLRVRSTY